MFELNNLKSEITEFHYQFLIPNNIYQNYYYFS